MRPPTSEEFQRVWAYEAWLKVISCKHHNMSIMGGEDHWRCADCGHSVRFMSEVQLDHMLDGPAEDLATRIDALDGEDPEADKARLDSMLEEYAGPEVKAAIERLVDRARWWDF